MRIGVVPSENADSALVGRIEDALSEETTTTDESAQTVLGTNPTVVIAVGESAVTDLVHADVSVPVLPVDAGTGLGSVHAENVESAVETLLSGDWTTTERPLLSASVDGDHVANALFDATLVTSEPARISEYAVKANGESVAQFRADAVVTATPAGSRGYARDAGGPVVQPGSGVVSVVPVAPFAIHVDNWVLRGPVTLSVERDEDAVVLLADDREVCPVEPHEPVELAFDGMLSVPAVSSERSFFEP
ncbi:NAD+ kinase [Haladaptatus litoreus]|uniref:NAD+ kinase n=1 Tax=Haladaptatus litoreus TaxID=553468 RepID=A0A1N6X847_9EURY|nr:NAD(+)/NADH kinase [Haladaptatus litoreus]SIQ98525.1 NAD+ kinase [Haladaptatus litoreus]